jgi:hypothetical protein
MLNPERLLEDLKRIKTRCAPINQAWDVHPMHVESFDFILLQIAERNRALEICTLLMNWREASNQLIEMLQLISALRHKVTENLNQTKEWRDQKTN